MTLLPSLIPEDSWVGIVEYRGRRAHKVFATNGDVLTFCNRWLKREKVAPADPAKSRHCALCDKADR